MQELDFDNDNEAFIEEDTVDLHESQDNDIKHENHVGFI